MNINKLFFGYKYIFVFIQLFICNFVFCQEDILTSDLIRSIVKEHAILKKYTENVTGKIVREYISDKNNKDDFIKPVSFGFYRHGDLIRLDYSFPRKGTDIYLSHKYDNITDVFLRTKENDYDYSVTASQSIPTANLFKRKRPSHEMDSILLQYERDIDSLYCLPGFRITDSLQKEIGCAEIKPFTNIENALWLIGKEVISDSGGKSNWKMVLNPHSHYALLYYEYYAVDKQKGLDITGSVQVKSQCVDDNWYPKEIIRKSNIDGKEQNTEKINLEIITTAVPSDKLFKEDIFQDMGRDYVLVEYDENQNEKSRVLIKSAPDNTRLNEYIMKKNPRLEWPWLRIFTLVAGIFFTLLFIYLKFIKTNLFVVKNDR